MPRLLLVDSPLVRQQQRLLREPLEALIPFSHGQWRLLILSWQPEQWRPTRRSVDEDLAFQQQTHDQLTRWGADLDGFLYLPSPVFGRRRQRARSLADVIKRYHMTTQKAWIISPRTQTVEAGLLAGTQAVQILGEEKPAAGALQAQSLEAALALLPKEE